SCSRNDCSGFGSAYGSPGRPPQTASRNAAVSRTLRETQRLTAEPYQRSTISGPHVIRPREGFKPTRPLFEAGIRIDPPPSLASASGTMRAATADAEPPLDPPAQTLSFHGLWVTPNRAGSVLTQYPFSGTFVFPIKTRPACLMRVIISASD